MADRQFYDEHLRIKHHNVERPRHYEDVFGQDAREKIIYLLGQTLHWKHREIAQALGISERTVRRMVKMLRGRAKDDTGRG